jgi:hypothetical protein
MLAVHLRFNHARTKQPLPVRLSVEDERGAVYAPLGRLPVFPGGRAEIEGGHLRIDKRSFTLIDGACEIRLPAGVPLTIRAFHGPEFLPLERTISLGAGQLSLRFEMEPWFDRANANLLSADGRAHFLSPHDALLEAAAEDLDFVNLLACDAPYHAEDGNTYRTLRNIAAFSGQVTALERGGRAVVVNTLNEHPMLGRLALLNTHRPVYPISFGGESSDDWGLADWCQQCHRKNGLAVWVNAFHPQSGLMGGEALACAILGMIDAIEVDAAPRPQPLLPWMYKLWNAGVLLPLVGGSGKNSNRMALGSMRTYARPKPDEPRNFASWIEAVRGGRGFAGNGPILDWNAETGEASAECGAEFDRLDVVANGTVVGSAAAERNGHLWRARLHARDSLPRQGWWAVRCIGATASPWMPGTPVFAHGSPIRLPEAAAKDGAAVAGFKALLASTSEWIEAEGRFHEAKFRTQMLDRCREAAARLG